MNLQESVVAVGSDRPAQHRAQPSRELLLHALNAAGAVPCRVYCDDFTFAVVDPAIQLRSGLTSQHWCSDDFWDKHLHPDDRAALDDARRVARLGWRDVSVAFRVVDGDSSVPMFLVGHMRAERAGRPALDAYLVPAATNTDRATGSPNMVSALAQARRDLVRAAQLAVAGELVGAITHDLRQPLTALQVNVEVATQALREAPPQIDVALAALGDAVDDSRKLRDSVQVLHSLAARREPTRTTVMLDAVVTEVARLVQSEADARRVQLTILLARGLPPLSADATMLREAVLSIVLDAIENAATDTIPAHVHVDTSLLDDSRVELLVTHRRREESTDDQTWALRVARSVAEAHGASVVVESAPGSEVTVRTVWPTSPAGAAHGTVSL
jgi:signal transduction histidine kinase